MGAVHLTFDNGPDPVGTPTVLRVLRTRGISATFFVLGRHLATPAGWALAAEARDAGHRLGNHSYTHETPLGLDPRPDAVALELERTQTLLDGLVGPPRWFRPFGGGGVLGAHLLSPAAVAWAAQRRATCVLWNCVPRDWEEPDAWAGRALADLGERAHTVLVLHDVVPAAMAHLDAFLGAALDAGHSFSDTFPPDCLPIVEGVAGPEVAGFVSAETELSP